MTREAYIKYRNEHSIVPIYQYYVENCKKGRVLDIGTFVNFFSLWIGAKEVFWMFFAKYDEKFEVMSIMDKNTGQIIKYL